MQIPYSLVICVQFSRRFNESAQAGRGDTWPGAHDEEAVRAEVGEVLGLLLRAVAATASLRIAQESFQCGSRRRRCGRRRAER